MKWTLILFFFSFFTCPAQRVINLGEHEGAIFSDTAKLPFRINDLRSRYTPSEEEARIADNLIVRNREKLTNIFSQRFKKEIKYSVRQFVGYMDTKGDQRVIVILLYRKARKHSFEEWKTEILLGFGDFYEQNQKILTINLTDKTVAPY